jgi:hypothetical protein
VAADYFTVKLQDAIRTLTAERVANILSAFSSPLNDDIEKFIKHRATDFSERGIARTHLVM